MAVENLSWVHGPKYGSKWTHSKTQDNIEHASKRRGIKLKKVNPKNTSQLCHVCGSTIVHNSRTRVAKCVNCQSSFDRDFNAAMNIVGKIKSYYCPNRERRIGDDCRGNAQVIGEEFSHNSGVGESSILVGLVT